VVHSMTGFGRGVAEHEGTRVTVEVSAVNRKQVDFRFVLPKELSSLEPLLRQRVLKDVSRGCLTVAVTYQLSSRYRLAQWQVDTEVATHAAARLRELARTLGIADRLTLVDLLALPGVVTEQENLVPLDELTGLVMEAVGQALTDTRRMQAQEGAALAADLRARTGRLDEVLTRIRAAEDDVVRHYRDRLQKRLAVLGVAGGADDDRVVREIAFVVERSDVSEETVRLGSHLAQLRTLLDAPGDNGRALEFLGQEMQREINTLGAKTCDTAVADLVLQFKNELGRIREQVCNVE